MLPEHLHHLIGHRHHEVDIHFLVAVSIMVIGQR